MMKLPPLNTLRFFESVARHQSIMRAATELCVTQSAVSRQISQLEESLGVRLFERRNRALFLTAPGHRLKDACRDMFQILDDTIRHLDGPDLDAPLVVSCEPTIMMRWLIPRLADFKQVHPGVQLHLFAAGGPINFARSHVDVALRRDDFNWDPSLHAELIGAELMGPVYAAGFKNTVDPERGAVHLLHTRTRDQAWDKWQANTAIEVAARHNAWFEHFYIMLEAVNAGMGVGISSLYMADRDLLNGNLIAPYGFAPDHSSYYLLSPLPMESDPRRYAFLRWLREAFAITETQVTQRVALKE